MLAGPDWIESSRAFPLQFLPLLAPLSKGRWGLFTVSWRDQQFTYRHLQRSGKPVQSFDRRVFNSALDPSDIRAVNTGV